MVENNLQEYASYGANNLRNHARRLTEGVPDGKFKKSYNEEWHEIVDAKSDIPVKHLNFVLHKVISHREIMAVDTLSMDSIAGKWSLDKEIPEKKEFLATFKAKKQSVSMVDTGKGYWILLTDMRSGCQLVIDSRSQGTTLMNEHVELANKFSNLVLAPTGKHVCSVIRVASPSKPAGTSNYGLHALYQARHLLVGQGWTNLEDPNINAFRVYVFQVSMTEKLFGTYFFTWLGVILLKNLLDNEVVSVLAKVDMPVHPFVNERSQRGTTTKIICDKRKADKVALDLNKAQKRNGKGKKTLSSSLLSQPPANLPSCPQTPDAIKHLFNDDDDDELVTPPPKAPPAQTASCPPVAGRNSHSQQIGEMNSRYSAIEHRLSVIEDIVSQYIVGRGRKRKTTLMPEKVLVGLKQITSTMQLGTCKEVFKPSTGDPQVDEAVAKEMSTNGVVIQRRLTSLRSKLFNDLRIVLLVRLDNLNVALKCLVAVRFANKEGLRHHVLELTFGAAYAKEAIESGQLNERALKASVCFLFSVEETEKTLRPWAQRLFEKLVEGQDMVMCLDLATKLVTLLMVFLSHLDKPTCKSSTVAGLLEDHFMNCLALTHDNKPVLTTEANIHFEDMVKNIDKKFIETSSLSESELRVEVEKSNIRYLVLHCNSLECQTEHADTCRLRGLTVRKELEIVQPRKKKKKPTTASDDSMSDSSRIPGSSVGGFDQGSQGSYGSPLPISVQVSQGGFDKGSQVNHGSPLTSSTNVPSPVTTIGSNSSSPATSSTGSSSMLMEGKNSCSSSAENIIIDV